MKLTDDIEALRHEVSDLHKALEVTNDRLELLTRPLHTINQAISIGLILSSGTLDKIVKRVLG